MSGGEGQTKESTVKQAKDSGESGKTSEKTIIKLPASYLEIIIGDGYDDNPFGHASLRLVCTADNLHIIYDFGRYGKTKALWGANWDFMPDDAAEQLNKLVGEGILRIWNGQSAANGYMAKESQKRNSLGYIYYISDEQAQKVTEHFKKLMAGGKKHSNGRDYIIDDWTPFHNCATVTLDGAKASGRLITNNYLAATGLIGGLIGENIQITPAILENAITSAIFGRFDEKRDYPKK